MKKTALFSVCLVLAFLILVPPIAPAFAGVSSNVGGKVEDSNNDGYPDFVFTATDALGQPKEGIKVDVFLENIIDNAFLSGTTNSEGVLLFKTVPAGKYTWSSSDGDVGTLEVNPIEYNIPDDRAFLMLFLMVKWCGDSNKKGESLLRGMANIAGYTASLPEAAGILDNYERGKQYYSWLSGLEDYVDSQKNIRSGVFTEVQKNLISSLKDGLMAGAAYYRLANVPQSLRPQILEWDVVKRGATDQYTFEYLAERGGSSAWNHLFTIGSGLSGLGLFLLGAYDLFIYQEPGLRLRVQAGQYTAEDIINVGADVASMCEGILTLAATIGKAWGSWGAVQLAPYVFAAKFFGAVGCFISAIMVILDLEAKYKGWDRVKEELFSPYVMLTMVQSMLLFAAGFVLAAELLGYVAIGSVLLGPLGIALIIAAAIVTIIKAIWDWYSEYWAYEDRIREQVSATMDEIIPIREFLNTFDLTQLEQEAERSSSIAELASEFAAETNGELKDDLEWTNKYFVNLHDAQIDFENSLGDARPVMDTFIKTHLYYDSADGTKHIRAHLEGINSTKAEYTGQGSLKSFPFTASIYDASNDDPNIFVFDSDVLAYNSLNDEVTDIRTEISDYSKISWANLISHGGWAYEPPIEHDAEDRTFAVTFTTDPSHNPSGTSTGYSFYFDPAGQWYANPVNPFRFDPDANYRTGSEVVLDPKSKDMSSFYHYKLFFDPGTTGEYWGLGRPDALDEWMQNIGNQRSTLESKLHSVSTALDKLRMASSMKRITVPDTTEKGLAWLRSQQRQDGSWYDGSWYGDYSTYVGTTSLDVLCFLNAGYDETDPTVNHAIQFILRNVQPSGAIYSSSNYHGTYETSLALMALVATHDNAYKTTIENARTWLVNDQWDENCAWGSVSKDNWYYGGIGYGDETRPDLSNTQFALLALDAAGLPKNDPLWTKAQVFLHRCQDVNFPITLNIDGQDYTVQPYRTIYNDGGFTYTPGSGYSYGSMHAAGMWGLFLSGVPLNDQRAVKALEWEQNHYTWDQNPPIGNTYLYYYYLVMSKALTMTGLSTINGHDWYSELYNKLVSLKNEPETGKWYWQGSGWNEAPNIATAFSILAMETRSAAPPVQRLSYLTFILRSNCFIRIIDPDGNLVGYNYVSGLGENNVPTALYSGPYSEPQYIVIVNPKPGSYKLELAGFSEGPYTLTIQGNYGEEVTKAFEYTGETNPGELDGSQVTVTAIVGPIDIYANQPTFEKTIDNIPPTTTLVIGQPNYVDPKNNVYVSSSTPFTLTAADNTGGTGIASTSYRIYNSTYNTGWTAYSTAAAFHLTGLQDGNYSIDYNSTDVIGNTEPTNTATVFVDNTPPTTTLTVGDPKYVDETCITPATLSTLEATDTGSDVYSTAYRIYNGTHDCGWRTCTAPFCFDSLTDGNYTIEYNSTDNVGNVEATRKFEVTLFCWNYMFEDTCGRGTLLKINTEHKFFQFICPDKDYGIREASSMQSCGTSITITYSDDELRLKTISIDTRSDYCQAMAWDLTTGKCYSILDQAGIEKSYAVVRGMDNRIYCRAWNGTGWEDWMVLPGATCDSPAAAILGNTLHIVVRGMDGNTLWYGYLSNPADPSRARFSGWTPLSGTTHSAPTLTSNCHMLCLVVRGLDDRIYYRWYSSGCWGSWSAVQTGATCDSPAAVLLGNDLHIVVRGMDGNSLWHTKVSYGCGDTPTWTLISGATSSRLVLVGSQGPDKLCLVVTGLDSKVYCRGYAASTDSWAGWTALPTGAACDGPAATMFLGELHIIVRGMDGTTLWHGYTDVSAGSFMGWTLLDGATGSPPTLTR